MLCFLIVSRWAWAIYLASTTLRLFLLSIIIKILWFLAIILLSSVCILFSLSVRYHLLSHPDSVFSLNLANLFVCAFNCDLSHVGLFGQMLTVLYTFTLLNDFISFFFEMDLISAFQFSLMLINLVFDLFICLWNWLDLQKVFHAFYRLFSLAIQDIDLACERLIWLKDLRKASAQRASLFPVLRLRYPGRCLWRPTFCAIIFFLALTFETVIENVLTQGPLMRLSFLQRLWKLLLSGNYELLLLLRLFCRFLTTDSMQTVFVFATRPRRGWRL